METELEELNKGEPQVSQATPIEIELYNNSLFTMLVGTVDASGTKKLRLKTLSVYKLSRPQPFHLVLALQSFDGHKFDLGFNGNTFTLTKEKKGRKFYIKDSGKYNISMDGKKITLAKQYDTFFYIFPKYKQVAETAGH